MAKRFQSEKVIPKYQLITVFNFPRIKCNIINILSAPGVL